MQLGEWIKAYRKEQGLSMQNFADLCGFSKAYIGQLEKGINPKTKRPMSPTMQTFTKIATSVGLSVDQLLERLDADQPVSITKTETSAPAARPAASESARKKGVRIPVLGRVVAGIPIEAVQEYDDWEEIPEEMARRGEYFALRVTGDSMKPVICNGDVIIVRIQPDVDTEQIAVVGVNGNEATVKNIIKDPHRHGITLYGYNADVYRPTFYS